MPPRRKNPNKKIPSINTTKPQSNVSNKESDEQLNSCARNASSDSKSESKRNDDQFKLEILWCVQEIESLRSSKKLSPKQDDDLLKTINILRSKKTPFIKKRQLMRQSCGDYKEKMASQLELCQKRKPKFSKKISVPENSQFVRKSASEDESIGSISNNLEDLSVGEDPQIKLSNLFNSKERTPFRFNFVPEE